MDFIDRLNELSAKIQRERDHILTEEATKTAWVMPFMNALGYNVFDPLEVIPEFTADVGTKKGERVDYCIKKDGEPILLIECKPQDSPLDIEHASQLYRYFSVTKVRFAILTNGISYKFYTDLEESNKMDSKPFFEFNMAEVKENTSEELKKFSKTSFDLDNILATASELKYTREIKRVIQEQMVNPSDDFVKLLISDVYSSIKTQAVVSQFANIVKRAFQLLINERINERLKTALESEVILPESQEEDIPISETSKVVTTEEETEAYMIVKAIVCGICDISKITMRDAQRYCSVLFEDNNRKPICRFHFNTQNKYIEVIDAEKNGNKYQIENLSDIYKYSKELKDSVASYAE